MIVRSGEVARFGRLLGLMEQYCEEGMLGGKLQCLVELGMCLVEQ